MNSKLPPKYTILFSSLFIVNTNKGGNAPESGAAELCPATIMASTGKARFVSTLSSVSYASVSIPVYAHLESSKWYLDIAGYIQC